MTQIEVVEKIIRQWSCEGVMCVNDNCPANGGCMGRTGGVFSEGKFKLPYKAIAWFKNWLKANKWGDMTTQERIEELKATIKEASSKIDELEKQVKNEKKIVFDDDKIYVAYGSEEWQRHRQLLLTPSWHKDHEEYSWAPLNCSHACSESLSGQKAIDAAIKAGHSIAVFTDTVEDLEFFIMQYKARK